MSETPISDQDLKRIERLCAQATAEPLAVIPQKRGRVILCQSDQAGDEVVTVAKYYDPNGLANATFAAAANREMRRLLQEVSRLRGLLARHGVPFEA